MEYYEEHRSWSTCCEQCLFAVFEIYSFLSQHPSRKRCSFSDLCIFCLLSSTKSFAMDIVTCWKCKKRDIFISPCRNEPSQLQNCRTRRFFTVFGTLLVTRRQHKEIFSPAPPPSTEYFLTLQNRCMFRLFFANSNVSFGLIREALHRFNGGVNIWSAPSIRLM